MKIHYAYRGAKVLYNFLVSNHLTGTFLLPANVCESVPDTFREAGLDVRFVDIQPDTLCMDEQVVMACVKDYTGLLMVHTYGTERSFDSFYRDVRNKKADAIIIDDRCLCMPDFEHEERYADVEADLTLFSLGNKKQVQLGEGGVGIVKDCWCCEDCAVCGDSMFESRTYSIEQTRYLNQKGIALKHVTKLQSIYRNHLPSNLQLAMEYNNWRFNIRVPAEMKEKILQTLFERGLFASSHYRSLEEYADIKTPIAVKLQSEIVNLFIDPKFYNETQAKETCCIINDILN